MVYLVLLAFYNYPRVEPSGDGSYLSNNESARTLNTQSPNPENYSTVGVETGVTTHTLSLFSKP